jgi:hypothetical protein
MQGEIPCITPDEYHDLFGLLNPSPAAPATPLEIDSLYSWPLRDALHDGVILVNYVDDDQLSSGVLDYMGGQHTYDQHRGTDLTLLSFRSMDRGVPVLAAADGVVLVTADGFFDRNIAAVSANANYVVVDHGSDNRTIYLHLRNHSICVHPGERVRRGQMIGLVGSSGSSTDAHLHFETLQGPTLRDPWSGTLNSQASLWRNQEPYVGASPLRVYDMGVFNAAAAGGNVASFPIRDLKERLSQPLVFGAGEPWLGVWIQLQGQGGDECRLEVRRPDQSLFSVVSLTLSTKIRYGWFYWYWALAGNQPQFGTWTATTTTREGTVNSLQFVVGRETTFAPRFTPVAGRSFRIASVAIHDVLHVSPLGGRATFALHHAPSFVSLEDSTVTINPPPVHRDRSTFFQVLATDDLGRQDTMWYHLVDFQAPYPTELPARVFVRGEHRSVPDAPSASQICLQIEPVDGAFDASDIDMRTVIMRSWDTGTLSEIAALSAKLTVVSDTDRNGIAEASACFSREVLARLFSKVRGRDALEVEVEGDLITGDRFRGNAELTVVGTGATLAASVAPNPLKPGAYLRFTSANAGPVSVKIFDLSGRLVRTLMDAVPVPAGQHSVWIDAGGGGPGRLASGVYFYRVEEAGGFTRGRFVVLK